MDSQYVFKEKADVLDNLEDIVLEGAKQAILYRACELNALENPYKGDEAAVWDAGIEIGMSIWQEAKAEKRG